MGKIVLIVLGVILVGYTIFANRTTNRFAENKEMTFGAITGDGRKS